MVAVGGVVLSASSQRSSNHRRGQASIDEEVGTEDKVQLASIKQQLGLDQPFCGFPTVETGSGLKNIFIHSFL